MPTRSRRFLESTALVVLLLLVLSRSAYAYLDPGTGSFILQILLAGLFVGGFMITSSWKRIVSFLSGLFAKKEQQKDDGP